MSKTKLNSLVIIRWLIYLDAVIWLLFFLITAFGLHPALPDTPWIRWLYAFLALLTGTGLIILFELILKGYQFAYFLLLGGLIIISVLSITDQVGIYDLLVMALNLAALILMLINKKLLLRK